MNQDPCASEKARVEAAKERVVGRGDRSLAALNELVAAHQEWARCMNEQLAAKLRKIRRDRLVERLERFYRVLNAATEMDEVVDGNCTYYGRVNWRAAIWEQLMASMTLNYEFVEGTFEFDPMWNPGGKLGIGLGSGLLKLSVSVVLDVSCTRVCNCDGWVSTETFSTTVQWDGLFEKEGRVGVGITLGVFAWINSVISLMEISEMIMDLMEQAMEFDLDLDEDAEGAIAEAVAAADLASKILLARFCRNRFRGFPDPCRFPFTQPAGGQPGKPVTPQTPAGGQPGKPVTPQTPAGGQPTTPQASAGGPPGWPTTPRRPKTGEPGKPATARGSAERRPRGETVSRIGRCAGTRESAVKRASCSC